MSAKHFGHIPGTFVGQRFSNRKALRDAGIHLPNQGGIHGTPHEGADSIVISGGYVDDEDHGDVIIYTGAGGNKDGKQIAHQSLTKSGNAGLVTSQKHQLPVRVVRGEETRTGTKSYRYDGLYQVTDHWQELGKDGFNIVRFRLERLPD